MGHPEVLPGAASVARFSEEEQAAIRAQLSRICENPLFSQSKRYPAVLRYIVEQALTGHTGELKERTIGIEVLHRSRDYDSGADPAVRITAGEVRKRLAQYYYEPGHEEELRIELPVGTYVPAFRFPNAPHSSTRLSPPATFDAVPRARKRLALWGLGFGVLVLAVAASAFYIQNRFRPATESVPLKAASSGFDQFWNQVVDANGSVQFCVGGWVENEPTGPGLAVTLSTYKTIGKITDLLEVRKKRYLNTLHVLGPEATDLSGFLDGPVIYVGYYMPLAPMMASWRYSFQKEAVTRTIWVHDRDLEFEKRWRTEMVPPQQRNESYAIVTRLFDRGLNRPIIIIAGIHSFATVGAVQVLTNPRYMEALLQDAPQNWQEMNFQAVVETRLENDTPAKPRILASHFWN